MATLLVGSVIGLSAGIGLYTFIYARGASYLTNDPTACANCHVMRTHYDAWLKSSHRSVAVCNDCHTPPNLIGKYITKADNGFHHSLAFTTGWFPDSIQIRPGNLAITEKTCRKCHSEIVSQIEGTHRGHKEMSCVKCHPSVGHLE